jgi:hypothetical protein
VAVVAATVSVPVVFPASVVSFAYVAPPLVDICHWTFGAGVPEAAAVNVALIPIATVVLAGLEVIFGASGFALTVSVAAVLVAEPAEFVKTAR